MLSQPKFLNLSDLQIQSQIGDGGQGDVYIANLLGSDLFYAIKQFREVDSKSFMNEIKALEVLEHENIIKFHGQDYQNQAIILELCEEGDIFRFKENVGEFSETFAKNLARQIISAIKFMHDRNWAHRDIKLDNILVAEGGQIKLCDFGMASPSLNGELFSDPKVGTDKYQGPEFFEKNVSYCAKKADIYAAGITIFGLVTDKFLFQFAHEGCQQFNRFSLYPNAFWARQKRCTQASDSFFDLINKMVCINPDERLDIDGVLSHPWFSG